MITDLCMNNDCQLSDMGRPEFFKTWEHWTKAHKGCYMDEDGRERNDDFRYKFTWNYDKEMWVKR